MKYLKGAVEVLKSIGIESEGEVPDTLSIEIHQLQSDRPLATDVSCLRSGMTGHQTRQDGVNLISALEGEPKDSVPLFANINHSSLGENRTPWAFAQDGQQAVEQGFNVIKCAPSTTSILETHAQVF